MTADAALGEDRIRPVRIWLYALAAFVLVMVLVGGATRLTESGLSITSWRPISGIIPPLSDADWHAEFEAYQQIPQYQREFAGWMGVEEFKLIFWWEWLHRFLGRMLGVAFAIPFAIFLVQRRIPRDLSWPLVGLFLLGGFQGFLGWWMVSSGLSELTSVSQYRLAAHLCAALVLFLALVWVARGLEPHNGTQPPVSRGWVIANWGLVALLVIQIAAGALVAGLHAGYTYNTWPLMDGTLVPGNLFMQDPAWRNLFENVLTVQFNHRMIAYLATAYVVALFITGWRRPGFEGVHGWVPGFTGATLMQVALGVITLVSVVNIPVALAHQALAFILAGMVVAYLSDMKRHSLW